MTLWMRKMQTYGIENCPRTIKLSITTNQYGTPRKNDLPDNSSQGLLEKTQVDSIFGKGKRRGIRRRGILQNDKVRGVDNARTSGTKFAAWLHDTIMTTPHDIAMQILCWLFNGKQGEERFAEQKGVLWVGLSADDLADAYHEFQISQLRRTYVFCNTQPPIQD